MSRRRYQAALSVVAASSWLVLGCAHEGGITIDTDARDDLRKQIVAAIPDASTFDTDAAAGDEDKVADGLFTPETRGLVQPHTAAHTDSLYHLKFLARIRVTRPYRGLAASPSSNDTVWNYWVVVRIPTSEHREGEWMSAYVANSVDGHISVRRLSGTLAPVRHPRALGKWRHSRVVPWATCSANMCCCEDTQCRTPIT